MLTSLRDHWYHSRTRTLYIPRSDQLLPHSAHPFIDRTALTLQSFFSPVHIVTLYCYLPSFPVPQHPHIPVDNKARLITIGLSLAHSQLALLFADLITSQGLGPQCLCDYFDLLWIWASCLPRVFPRMTLRTPGLKLVPALERHCDLED